MGGRKIKNETREQAQAMLRAGKSYRMISNALDLSIGTVHNIAREVSQADMNRMVAEIKRGNVARCLMMADFLMEELADAVRSNTSVKDLAIAAAIMTDKAILLEKLQEKQLKAKNLALQIGTTVPGVPHEDEEPLPEELNQLKETVRCPDNAETNQIVAEGFRALKEQQLRKELDIQQ